MRIRTLRLAAIIATAVAIGATVPRAPAAAQGGPPGMGRGTMGDSTAAAIMPTVHELLMRYRLLRRTVTTLPNGVRTLTESDDSTTRARLREHVASTGDLVARSQDLHVPPASPALHELLRNGAKIVRTVTLTPGGVAVTETSDDPAVVRALQTHAAEVTALVERGMAAMHEAMRQRRAPPPHRP